MKALAKLFFLAMAIAYLAMPSNEQALPPQTDHSDDQIEAESQELDSSDGSSSRFLAQSYNNRYRMTCNKFPRVCWVPGSPGPDCCKKQCVNVTKDRRNCGRCGRKCKYSEICCRGQCVNPMSNEFHCGGCFNRCKKGDTRAYGMCNCA